MRHKQQPTKSSRHKSLTFIIDSHTSFGNQHQQQQQHNHQQQQHQQQHNNNNKTTAVSQRAQAAPSGARHGPPSSCSLLQQACLSMASSSSNPIKVGAPKLPSAAAQKANSHAQVVGHQRSTNDSRTGCAPLAKLATGAGSKSNGPSYLSAGSHSLLSGSTGGGPGSGGGGVGVSGLEDEFEHNDEHMRHMSSVMRLAFLENNDIPLDDCTSVDFNSMSTASLLQRNIQQQLLHERRDQLKQQLKQQQLFFQQQQEQNYNKQQQQLKQLQQQQLRQQKQQQQLLQQQQQLKQQLEFNKQQHRQHFNNSSSSSLNINHNNDHQLNQSELNPIDLDDENDDEEDNDDNVQDLEEDDDQDYYDVSESTIFATTGGAPISSSSAATSVAHLQHHHQNMKNISSGKCSTPKSSANNGRNLNSASNHRTPKGSARSKKRISPKNNSNSLDSHHQSSIEFPKLNAQVDTSCGGFLCDEQGCGKSFPSVRKLRHHKVVHSDEFPFVCEFNGCGKKFKRKFGIDLHSTTHFDLDPHMYKKTSNHSSLPFFGRRMQYSMCKPCGQKFKTVHEYQYHMLKHGKEPFRCPVKGCGQTFGIWKSFQKHRASHYFNYFCKMDALCDHQTSNLQLLKLHIYCCHFRRKLPETSTMAALGGDHEENSISDDDIDIMDEEADAEADGDADVDPDAELDTEADPEEEMEAIGENQDSQVHDASMDDEQNEHEDKSSLISIKHESPSIQESPIETEQSSSLRRDCRLRRNPPRSTTFGQDYATINNGGYTKPTLTSSPGQSKSTRFQIQLCASGRSSVVKKKENSSNKCKLK